MKLAAHKLTPQGTLCGCKGAKVTEDDGAVTCPRCLRMMATAAKAKALQKIPPERWP